MAKDNTGRNDEFLSNLKTNDPPSMHSDDLLLKLHDKMNELAISVSKIDSKIMNEIKMREELDIKLSDAMKALRLESEEKLRSIEERFSQYNITNERCTENGTLLSEAENDKDCAQSTPPNGENFDEENNANNEENDITNPLQYDTVERQPLLARFFAFVKRSTVEFEVNPTIHAFAIFSLAKRHWTMALTMIFISFAFLTLQYCVLSSTFIESFTPTCSAHSDCRVGTYCGSFSLPWLVHRGKHKSF